MLIISLDILEGSGSSLRGSGVGLGGPGPPKKDRISLKCFFGNLKKNLSGYRKYIFGQKIYKSSVVVLLSYHAKPSPVLAFVRKL